MREIVLTVVLGRRLTDAEALESLDLPPAAVEGVVFRRGRLVPWLGGVLARMGRPAAAVTLGHTIVLAPGLRATRSLLIHELAHVRQWEREPFFAVRYALATLRHGYHDNPYEVEARRLAAADRHPSSGEETA